MKTFKQFREESFLDKLDKLNKDLEKSLPLPPKPKPNPDHYIIKDLKRREQGKTFSRRDLKFSVQHMGKTKAPSEVTPSYMPFIPSKQSRLY